MLNIDLSLEDLRFLSETVYEFPKHKLDDGILRRVIPHLLDDDEIYDLDENKVCIHIIHSTGSAHSFILVRKNGWDKFTMTEKNPQGNTYNRYDIIYHNGRYHLEEINPDFRKTCINPFNTFSKVMDAMLSTASNKTPLSSMISTEELKKDWEISCMVTLCYTIGILHYVLKYQGKEYSTLKKKNTSNIDISLNTNIYKQTVKAKKEAQRNLYEIMQKKTKAKPVEEVPKKKKDDAPEIADLKNQLADAIKERDKYKNEIVKYKNLLNVEKEKNEELSALRKRDEEREFELEHLRNALIKQTTEDDEEGISFEEMTDAIKDFRILIIGGHDNWHCRLSKFLNNLVIISHDDYMSDFNVIYKADSIYFFTNYIGHGVYNKALDLMREHDIDYGYINTTNLEQNIGFIYKDMKDRGLVS